MDEKVEIGALNIKNFLIITLGLSALIAAFSLAYYLIIFIPQRETMKINLEKEKLQQQADENEKKRSDAEKSRILLDACLQKAKDHYTYDWNGNCKLRDLGEKCTLPNDMAILINSNNDKKEQECRDQYPQK